LNDEPVYTFTAAPGEDPNRFLLHFHDATAITNPDAAKDFTIYAVNGTINVLQTGNLSGKVTVTDMAGRTIATASIIAGLPTRINIQGHTGVYIVSVLTTKGISNAKIVVK
jgi:phage baseplate assembly protein gpV